MTLGTNGIHRCAIEPIERRMEHSNEFFSAACKLHQFKNDNVFIMCSSGVSRGPTLAALYLALFKRVRNWQYPSEVCQNVEASVSTAHANEKLVNRVLLENQTFHQE